MNTPEGYSQAQPCAGRIGESGVLACPNVGMHRLADGRLYCQDCVNRLTAPVPEGPSYRRSKGVLDAVTQALGQKVERDQRTKNQERRRDKQRARAKARNMARKPAR